MGFLDNIITAISPERGYRREAWRQALEELRGYDAASHGRLNAGWRVFNESAELTDRYSRDVIRARARDLERNSDIAQSVIHAFRRNVIGKGYKLQAKTESELLNDQLDKLWKQWCRKENCDITASQSFTQIMRMAVTRKQVDGGILFIKRYTRGGLVPFKLQMIEVDELDTTASIPRHKGNTVVSGIEYDPARRAVGYFIQQYDVEGWKLTTPVYIEAKHVIPYWTKHRPSQLREVSDLSPTITRVRDTNEFITAVSVKERIAACLAVFIKRATPTGGFGRGGVVAGGDRVTYEGKSLTPGMIKEMNVGDSIETVEPKSAGSDASQFLKMQWRLIGAGQGMSYEATSRDMSESNYSSARQGANEDEATFAAEIELLSEIMSEIYETFVISCYLAGLINPPGFWDKKADYLAHKWVQAPKKWIDPAKETTATKTALATGQKTFQDVAAEQGKDWKEAVDEMAEVLKYGRKAGIEMGGVIYLDIAADSTGATVYTAVKTAKEKLGASSNHAAVFWPKGAVGEKIYCLSAMAAAETAATDAANGDVPYESPSNKDLKITATVLDDGTEVALDQEQANLLNGQGVITAINANGFKLWGNNTAA